MQASVPVSQLQVISGLPFVNYVRSPRRPFLHTLSEGVGVINATPFNNLGIRGQGVKIAVIDVGFAGYQSKLGSELPGNVTTIWYTGDITGGGETHGTAVAEIIYDIAPDAQFYLIKIGSDVEFLKAVDDAMDHKVDIISMSLGWLDGPFDGTSTISVKVDSAVSSGIVWVNSAGNYAQKHWEGKFNDPDNNGIHNFTASSESMSISGGNIVMVLSWDDWPVSNQDYDLYVYNNKGDIIASSRNVQNGAQTPTETISTDIAPGKYNLQIYKDDANKNVTFELYSAYQNLGLQYQVPSRSLSVPADARGAITVGATYWSDDSLEPFSSRGPTTDSRTKPDMVAPDGVQTSTSSSFYGTSASAPHVAGAAALLKSINSSLTPAALLYALKSTAKGLGDPNSYGAGRIDVWKAALMVDKKPPAITIGYPTSGQTLKTSIISVTGTASDNLGLNKVEIKVGNGAWQNATGKNSWSSTLTLSPGQNTILARATDTAGNTNETSITVTLDTVLPIIILESPANGQKLNTSTTTISGTASDDLGLDKVEVRAGNGAWQNASGTNSWSAIITLSPGLNTISARAMDNAGNIQNTSVNVTLDITDPTITIAFPKESQKFNKSVITVTGTAYDNDLSKVEIMVGTGTWQNASGTNSWSSTINLSQGPNTILVRATDTAGNTNETSITVTLDTVLPIIILESPVNGQKLNTSTITVRGTASGALGLGKVEVRAGNGAWQNASGTNSWSAIITLSPGLNTISARQIV